MILLEPVGMRLSLNWSCAYADLGVASMMACGETGADVIDVAIDCMSGLTSQPSMGAIVGALQDTPLDTGIDFKLVSNLNDYWELVRGQCCP